MEIVTSKTRSPGTERKILSQNSALLTGLKDSIEKLQNNHSKTRGDISSNILLRTPDKKVVLTAAHDGTEVFSFQSNDSVTIQVFEGILRFDSAGKTEILTKCQFLTLYDNVEFHLTAIGETMFMITISNDSEEFNVKEEAGN